jgi:hypothetical protein
MIKSGMAPTSTPLHGSRQISNSSSHLHRSDTSGLLGVLDRAFSSMFMLLIGGEHIEISGMCAISRDVNGLCF